MDLEKVQELIIKWFKSEAGIEEDSKEINEFVADQFKKELKPKGILSAHYNLIMQGKPIYLQQLFK